MYISTESNEWGYKIPIYLSDSSTSTKSRFFFISEYLSRNKKLNKSQNIRNNNLKNETNLYNNYSQNHFQKLKFQLLIKDIQIDKIYKNRDYIKRSNKLRKTRKAFPYPHLVNVKPNIQNQTHSSLYQFNYMNDLIKNRISKNKLENKRLLLSGKKININEIEKPKVTIPKPKYILRKKDFISIVDL